MKYVDCRMGNKTRRDQKEITNCVILWNHVKLKQHAMRIIIKLLIQSGRTNKHQFIEKKDKKKEENGEIYGAKMSHGTEKMPQMK